MLIFVLTAPPAFGQCQPGDVDLQVDLREIITQAQVLSLSTLGVDRRGQGQQVATLIIANNSSKTCSQLYLHILVRNTSAGVIARLDQQQGEPFQLDPQQVVRATNNDLQQGLPGIETSLSFDGGLTSAGEDFINDLQGQTSLPDDVYSIRLAIYQGANRESGGTRVASATATVGEQPLSSNKDIYINAPGGEVSSNAEFIVNSSQPQFAWSGEGGESYRLVVVDAERSESPESLLDGARSTQPVLEENQSTGNTLLEYEMADVRLSSSNFRYPSSGIKQLEPGKRYYWQVTTLTQTPEGEREVNSEIWSFTVAERNQGDDEVEEGQMTEQMQQNLRGLLGSETFSFIQQQDMDLQSVIIDGQRYSGQAMIKKLNQFMQRARNGDVTIVNDEE